MPLVYDRLAKSDRGRRWAQEMCERQQRLAYIQLQRVESAAVKPCCAPPQLVSHLTAIGTARPVFGGQACDRAIGHDQPSSSRRPAQFRGAGMGSVDDGSSLPDLQGRVPCSAFACPSAGREYMQRCTCNPAVLPARGPRQDVLLLLSTADTRPRADWYPSSSITDDSSVTSYSRARPRTHDG
ncbi:hypothetical protein M409DRAFT_49301 [Zasmidium cellare ATCC 36951]|uniref:Uncharacterized protein n=1 Tax=Zasmidium cellare ATCC 36951 TaxID=1080233 RepID=A0A6A6D3Q7_ZASCE|nr:uncharacterized protein M409DRAFT_49301 [Zasmidium cellare ATCC 36951]KAF2172769.1 hypothetical protein M409DRAFT_49301 [Zasmidium cellare ATCC 36951]